MHCPHKRAGVILRVRPGAVTLRNPTTKQQSDPRACAASPTSYSHLSQLLPSTAVADSKYSSALSKIHLQSTSGYSNENITKMPAKKATATTKKPSGAAPAHASYQGMSPPIQSTTDSRQLSATSSRNRKLSLTFVL